MVLTEHFLKVNLAVLRFTAAPEVSTKLRKHVPAACACVGSSCAAHTSLAVRSALKSEIYCIYKGPLQCNFNLLSLKGLTS